MAMFKSITKMLLYPTVVLKLTPIAGVKTYPPPLKLEEVEKRERSKLKVVPKAPIYTHPMRPFKTQKRLRLMRGPEELHNTLQYEQIGLIATGGGRMKHCHFETIRRSLLKPLNYNRVFAEWRVPDPWQPISKKAAGARMGRGKGSIDHYVTPVKAGQVIFEIGGQIEFLEIKRILTNIAKKMPFDAIPVTQEMMEQMAINKKRLEEENLNPWTWKYIIQNNMLGCHKWISKYDRRWFNEYV